MKDRQLGRIQKSSHIEFIEDSLDSLQPCLLQKRHIGELSVWHALFLHCLFFLMMLVLVSINSVVDVFATLAA